MTPELLQSRILGLQDSSEIDEGTKARLIDLYSQSLANLELVRAHRQAEEEYRRAEQVSPIEMESVRRLIEQRRTTEPPDDLGITPSTSFDELDRIQQEELANLTAVQARLSALDARLEAES